MRRSRRRRPRSSNRDPMTLETYEIDGDAETAMADLRSAVDDFESFLENIPEQGDYLEEEEVHEAILALIEKWKDGIDHDALVPEKTVVLKCCRELLKMFHLEDN